MSSGKPPDMYTYGFQDESDFRREFRDRFNQDFREESSVFCHELDAMSCVFENVQIYLGYSRRGRSKGNKGDISF
jgi:hypothetical protein